MSKKYNGKNRYSPNMYDKPGSMDALLMVGNKASGLSDVFVEIRDEEFFTELDQQDVEEIYKLIEELENKDEKDN